jgi:heat shock protein HslJ
VRRIVALFVVVALALGGCSISDLTDDRTPGLDGTAWSLTGWTEPKVDPVPFRITAWFDEGRISGRSGVNRYSGNYTIGPGTAFLVDSLASTEMAGPPEAMQAERAFQDRLTAARTYRREGGVLILGDATGKPMLILTPLPDWN